MRKIRKNIYKFSSSGGILHISAKLQGGICKTSCWLTEKFDGGGKLINVVQFQGGNWSFVNFRGVIDETYNFRGVIAYLLHKYYRVKCDLKFSHLIWKFQLVSNTIYEIHKFNLFLLTLRFLEEWDHSYMKFSCEVSKIWLKIITSKNQIRIRILPND